MANPSYLALTVMNGQILYSGRVASTAPTTVYTVPAGKTAKIATGVVCNTSGLASVVNDGVLNATTTVTSATANFSAVNVGKSITGTGIPAGATIASVTNATTIVLSAAATATATGVTLSYLWPSAPCLVSVSLHQVGQALDGTHRVVAGYSLAAGDSLSLKDYLGGAFLAEGEFVSVQSGTANVLTMILTGAVSG